jgi:GNAT superfamily N-acetyltransferase
MGFHPEGFGEQPNAERNRSVKESLVRRRKVHQTLAFAGDECVGWCQYGTPAELPNIKNAKAYGQDLDILPDWRIGCVFTDKRHRGAGVARAAVTATLEAIREAGGGVVEAYPEQVAERKPQAGAFFHTGPETLFEELGFTRERRIAKWRWVMRLRIDG